MKFNHVIMFNGLLLTLLVSFCASAEVVLNSASDVVGTWKLNSSSPRREGEKRPANATWEFRNDGTLVTTAVDSRTKGGEFTVTVKYHIKDGKIISNQPGRSRKIIYTVEEKDEHQMVLHGGMDAYLFFTKQ